MNFFIQNEMAYMLTLKHLNPKINCWYLFLWFKVKALKH